MLRCLRKISRAVDSMSLRRRERRRLVCILACVVMCLMAPRLALASEYHGRVTFGGLPVPRATITATQASQKIVAVSDQQGSYPSADLADGTSKLPPPLRSFSPLEPTLTR